MAVPSLDHSPSYLSNDERALLERAYQFAARAHEGQKRLSGEDYIEHPLAVVSILTELEGDAETLAAAMLHDVVEDTPVKALRRLEVSSARRSQSS